MKKVIFTLICIISGLILTFNCHAQCTPGDSISCPDIGNNGEICPDYLPIATAGQLYLEEFTILPPSEYILDTTSGSSLELHHLEILDVGNLPPGFTWDCNAEDSILMAGIYYCVLLEGTTAEAGHFPLKIVVDVYIPGILGSPPIKIATVTDSTSLFIDVIWDPFGIDENNSSFSLIESLPNPFSSDLKISFYTADPKEINFEIFNLLGTTIHSEFYLANPGKNNIYYDGSELSSGIYIYSISDSQHKITKRIIKSN